MSKTNSVIKPVAQAGLIAKGIVYCLLGLLAFMAAFHISGQSANSTDRTAVFEFVEKQPGGQIMLGVIALGLICYTFWRIFQASVKSDSNGKNSVGKRLRYIFSGIVYGVAAYSLLKNIFASKSDSGNNSQDMVREVLTKPYGQILVGAVALTLLIIGIYQIYYGLSEKYKEHVDKVISNNHREALLNSGKIGYVARGAVWIIIAFLFFKAALHSNASEAGDTSKAFDFLQSSSYGSYLLAAVALGLICYGTFNFVRARFENFG